jgi:bisphosphoglycerate-dependent phosphoglycerate mutase
MLDFGKKIYKFSTLPLVIVRHGQTNHNKFKQWSGWHDAKLSPQGQEEAEQCGRLLKQNNF